MTDKTPGYTAPNALFVEQEAPISITVKVALAGPSGATYDTLLSVRGASGDFVLSRLNSALAIIEEAGGGSTLFDRPTGGSQVKPGTQSALRQTEESADGLQVSHIVKVATKPRMDGKLEVGFFEAGHKFPDLRAFWTPDQAAVELGGIVHIPESGLCEVPAACLVYWTLGQPKPDGKRYKDVVSVAPVGGA